MLIASLLILSFGNSKLATIGWAQGGTTVRIDPASRNVGLGGTATTDVLVENVTDLYGFEFQITFDQTLVEGVQVQPGSFLSPDWEIDNTIDNTNGTIDYALSQQNPSKPVTGTGTLATITWYGKAGGTSPITLTHVLLGAAGGISITAGTQDGEITVVAASIGDYVWIDEDGDGKQGSILDVGINDVDVELWLDNDGDGNVSTGDTDMGTTTTITNTVTGKGGWYLFDGLSAGDYIVRIAPAEFDLGGTLWYYGPTEPNVGSDDTVDSDGDNPTCPYSPTVKTGSCGEIGFENNILATTTLTNTGGAVSGDLDVDFGVVAQAPPTAITLSSFTSRSSAGLGASLVWLWLAGVATLVTSGILWVRHKR